MMQYLESTGYKQSTGGIEPTKEKKIARKHGMQRPIQNTTAVLDMQ
jgi:hypothetical protein